MRELIGLAVPGAGHTTIQVFIAVSSPSRIAGIFHAWFIMIAWLVSLNNFHISQHQIMNTDAICNPETVQDRAMGLDT